MAGRDKQPPEPEQDGVMATPNDPGKQSRLLSLMLAILGLILLAVGWYRWAT
jgi:hypothetical protein